MKLAEALNRLNNIEKQLVTNNNLIEDYSSDISSEIPKFGSEEKQKIEVNNLIEENKKLLDEYLDLKDKINITNSTVKIDICGETKTINQFLTLSRNYNKLLLETYEALNESTANNKRIKYDTNVYIIRFYDEKFKIKNIQHIKELINNIYSSINLANSKINLIE